MTDLNSATEKFLTPLLEAMLELAKKHQMNYEKTVIPLAEYEGLKGEELRRQIEKDDKIMDLTMSTFLPR